MKDNLIYFQYSINNLDDFLDLSNPNGSLIIAKTKESDPSDYQKKNHELLDLIITYDTLRSHGINDTETEEKILLKIVELLENSKLVNYSAFLCLLSSFKFFIWFVYRSHIKFNRATKD